MIYTPIVQKAISRLDRLVSPVTRTALLLFGSHGRGVSHAASDVDFLVITNRSEKRVRRYPDVTLDLILETPERLHRQLAGKCEWNNHFALNVLTDAVILEDPAGVARTLQALAMQRSIAGPAAMTKDEAKLARRALQRMLESAKSDRMLLEEQDAERKLLCKMRLDQVVSRSIYLYCMSVRRWTSSLPATVAMIRDNEPELYQRWRAYVYATNTEASEAAKLIVTFTRDALRRVNS